MIQHFDKLPRKTKQALMIIYDAVAIVGSIIAAFSIRLGNLYIPEDFILLMLIIASPIFALSIFSRFGLYHDLIRYIGFQSLLRIVQAVSFYAILWGLIALMLPLVDFPRSVVLINWLLVIIVVVGSRLIVRWLLSDINVNNNVLIYGAGEAGRQLSNALIESKESKPVAFIDDANEIYRHSINGLTVYSPNDLRSLIKSKNIKEVLLAIPSISRIRRNEIINYLAPYPIIVRTLPGVSALAQGKVRVNDLLEIDITDLLGRDLVKPNTKLLETNISDKVVMVTGAGGSIGSELCRQIVSLKPKKIVLYEISESSLYIIEQELLNISTANVEVNPIIGSVTDKDRMKVVYDYYQVQTVYHAAAYKHVPLVELNPTQGVYNNAIGTMIAAEAAIAASVETFVLISTDKAVRPTSVMGASKRVAELVLQALAEESKNTCFTMVRFGNVLDSSGSVIPLFKKQIIDGGPITVTHSDVMRYFMTIPEAVELVIQAGAMSRGGEVFVLDMGKPILIYDLAVKMIKLSGLQVLDENNPNGDIEIKFTGLRPGEKLYEELLVDDNFTLTQNKLIMRAEEKIISWDQLKPILNEIGKAALNSDTKQLYLLLSQLISGSHLTTNGFNEKD